ncbi:MAG: metallophosphoesterase family protein [Candidatus Izemoplasmataceae bacterium]
MIIGVISDVHNNVVALNNILELFRERNCEMVICAGDVIGIGPNPEETINRLREVENLVVVEGNHEGYLNHGMDKNKMGEDEFDYHKWEHKKLSSSSKKFINNLPIEKYFDVNGKTIYIVHYGLEKAGYKGFKRNPSQLELDRLFKDVEADVVIFGHDHAPTEIKGRSLYINPGSCGCPGRSKNIARCGILEITDTIRYEQISLEYNVDEVLGKIEELNYPAKEEIKKFFFGL